jgi:poly [ADP-ribose] polymerase
MKSMELFVLPLLLALSTSNVTKAFLVFPHRNAFPFSKNVEFARCKEEGICRTDLTISSRSMTKRIPCTSLFSTPKKINSIANNNNDNTTKSVVNPLSNINGTIQFLDNETCDCTLVQVDPTKNMDKYFILQLIQSSDNDDSYIVYSRSGRTGTAGRSKQEIFDTGKGAINSFKKKFKQKTGLKWEDRGNPTVSGKYRVKIPSIIFGVIDHMSNIKNGTIIILDKDPCDCMLVRVDPTKNVDKYFILQLIQSSDNDDSHIVYSRWGRTGKAGRSQQEIFDNKTDAIKAFKKKFKQKTGLKWEEKGNPTVSGKYRIIKQDFVEKKGGYSRAKWQYWVDDGVDGKATGWYDYDKAGSRRMEQLFQESLNNYLLANRLVDSGVWSYSVDLVKMIQTNVKHPNRTSRHIRRYIGKEMDDDVPPSSATSVTASPAMTVISAPKQKKNSKVTPSTATSVTVTASSASKEEKTIKVPVDNDINGCSNTNTISRDFVVVKNADDQWYDVVLNQCNIIGSSNSNKYYRLQLLKMESRNDYYVFLKWGRVGLPHKCDLVGPFASEEDASRLFANKYKQKTKNTWGDDKFKPYKGKYTRIEIDYEAGMNAEVKAGTDQDFEYLESKLNPKTRELIEVLFSKKIRDGALNSFNLDLKKLPLGNPSQQQIQNGVTILKKIEDKLNGDSVSEGYPELSSQFYTSIPHSFGLRKPPTISTRDSLQNRYDMCNILLDMFSTSETIRQIEALKTKKKVPYPADSHYASLNAELSLIDLESPEYEMIKNYFDKTKESHSSAQLLNVWSVEREGESQHYKKFANIDNRRLLWHGTNIAVVAPIITSGLRIMPHSRGRVGSGIYLASLQEKSAQYTRGYGNKCACMFLCEGALGKTHEVKSNAPYLKNAPVGYDSVHAVGAFTPKSWTSTEIEGKSVKVPQDKKHQSGVTSDFDDDEFLVYDEAQVRLRYVVTIKK